MNMLEHSVLEVPSGGYSWVVEKGVPIGVSAPMLVSFTSANRLLRG